MMESRNADWHPLGHESYRAIPRDRRRRASSHRVFYTYAGVAVGNPLTMDCTFRRAANLRTCLVLAVEVESGHAWTPASGPLTRGFSGTKRSDLGDAKLRRSPQ